MIHFNMEIYQGTLTIELDVLLFSKLEIKTLLQAVESKLLQRPFVDPLCINAAPCLNHCVKSVCIQSFLVRIESECRKIRIRKTPNMDTFHAVNVCQETTNLTIS